LFSAITGAFISDARLDFKSKKIRVNLNLPIKAEVKAESTDVLKTVDEDRKYVIQATIVRYVVHFIFAMVL
jgi:cullin 1